MAWFKRRSGTQKKPESAVKPVLASAAVVSQAGYRTATPTRDWQNRAWRYYDECSELRASVQWVANALSRARLYVGVPDPDGSGRPDPVVTNEKAEPKKGVDPRAQAPLDALFGGPTGMGEALMRMGQQLTVVGETYVAGYPSPDAAMPGTQWRVLSNFEFEQSGEKIKIFRSPLPNFLGEEPEVEISQGRGTMLRIWRPHARLSWEADSPLRALLSTLEELQAISAHIHASLESRLAGAGMLVLPESATLPSADVDENSPLARDPETAALIEAMVTAIQNRDAASAIVPIICRIADEAAAKVEHLTFSTPLDDKVLELRASAIRRFAVGMDLPPEIVLGLSEAVHQKTGRQVEEMSLKLHVEPLLSMICDALSQRYLWPTLQRNGVKDPRKYVVAYDISELAQRPDRGPAARELYSMGLLSPDSALRESGFGDHEVPDEDFARLHLIAQLAMRGIPAEVGDYYLRLLGMLRKDSPAPPASSSSGETRFVPEGTNVPGRPRGRANGTRIPAGDPAAPAPGQPGGPTMPKPSSSLAAVATLQGWSPQAVEMACLRALEIAGKRLLSRAGRAVRREVDCEPWRVHTQLPTVGNDADMDRLLEGAFTALDVVMPGQPVVRAAADAYVRHLIVTQTDHSPQRFMQALHDAGCLAGTVAATGGGQRATA